MSIMYVLWVDVCIMTLHGVELKFDQPRLRARLGTGSLSNSTSLDGTM